MPRVIEGDLIDSGGKYVLIVSRFNDFITGRLMEGALDTLRRHGVDTKSRVDVVWAPGAYEVPLLASKIAATGRYDAAIALACVIRGGTPHFDFVANEISKGLANISISSGLPISFGVLTTNTIDQAVERAGTKMGNKGSEAALAALEMVNLLRAIDGGE